MVIQNIGDYIEKGGWMMIPLLVLAFVLFTSLFRALIHQWLIPEGDGGGQATFDRRLRILKVLTSVAPLLGLLGTVVGMLKTFRGLSDTGVSGTENLVAIGISEALVTTQMGLSIGVVGLTGILFFRHAHQKYLLREYQRHALSLRSVKAGGDA